eukprot:gnl/TRDRNA2_/TRDRNA2_94729_c0_seq2.p1 gnl/TRDRNA2_/TRDRNA2_94729_c0~~gnl/TRDRNA2_/TRDRNA2_94729_c0_seq2.p1  ORF type:complete len:221 (+),score=32.92 gnl/TRDRNA2_/TRDRNA2_94729_c0_seq2:58-663(+)
MEIPQGSKPTIRVIVQNLGGKQLELQVLADQSVRELKELVLTHWGFPVVCQQLMIGANVLPNTSSLAEHCGAVPGENPTSILCVYSMPHEGSIEKAAAAGDREAVRALMQERDKDRAKEPLPAILCLCINRANGRRKGWPRIAEALVDRGYTLEEVDAAIAMMPDQHCYNDVIYQLESSCRKIKDKDVPLLTWWKRAPQDN